MSNVDIVDRLRYPAWAHSDAPNAFEYVSRKDSLCESERLASVRTVVCAAISRSEPQP